MLVISPKGEVVYKGATAEEVEENVCEIIEEAVDKAGYKWGEEIFVALDPATSELWNEAQKDGKEGYKFSIRD